MNINENKILNKLNHLRGNKWIILFITVLFPFMATLDTNVVTVALPVLSEKLSISSSGVTWIATSYLIVMAASILFFGKLGDIMGQTKVFQGGVILFTLGSYFSGLSTNFYYLIISRIVQALGASATLANSHAIITKTFNKSDRGRALGINGAFVALGTLSGPSLGGLILSITHWQYIFWINVPIGILIFVLGLLFYPKESKSFSKIDLPGSVLFGLSVIGLFIGLQEGRNRGYLSPFILSCFLGSIITLFLFIKLQKKQSNPLLDLNIFRNRWFSISIFCAFTSYMAISCYSLLQPFYLQKVLQMTPAKAGIIMTIYPLIIVLLSPFSGFLSDRIAGEKLTLIGLLFTCLGLFLMSGLKLLTPLAFIILFVIIMAIGNGFFQSPNNSIVMSSLLPKDLGVGGSINALSRTIGQTTGIAISNTLLYAGMSHKLDLHVTDFIPGQESAFLYGMKLAYICAGVISLIGFLITAIRLYHFLDTAKKS